MLFALPYIKKDRTVSHDNELSPGDDEIKKNSVTSVAKSNFMAGKNCGMTLMVS